LPDEKPEKKREKLTKGVVEDADLTPDRVLWDTEIPGFGLRIRSGRRVYVLKYGSGKRGVSRWMTIGEHMSDWRPDKRGRLTRLTCEAARLEARRLRGIKAGGQDPAQLRDNAAGIPTLVEFGERYVKEYSDPHKAERVAKEDRRKLAQNIGSKPIGKLRLDHVGSADVTRWHLSMSETKVEANRTLSLVSHMLTMARRWGVLPPTHANPCRDVRRFPEKKRKRFLSQQELTRVGVALAHAEAAGKLPAWDRGEAEGFVHANVANAVRMLLFTGCRPGEICNLRWDAIRDGVAMLKRKGRGQEPQPVTLTAPALKLMSDLPRVSEWVFPSVRYKDKPLSLSTLENGWARVAKLANVADTTPHTLRHSFASIGALRKHSLLMIGSLLGHTQVATTQRYAHLANDPIREAADDIAGEIETALTTGVKPR
jgi:integrase